MKVAKEAGLTDIEIGAKTPIQLVTAIELADKRRHDLMIHISWYIAAMVGEMMGGKMKTPEEYLKTPMSPEEAKEKALEAQEDARRLMWEMAKNQPVLLDEPRD